MVNILMKLKRKMLALFKSTTSESFTKISVVIPTFNTKGESLKTIINSLDHQTMRQEEFEVIFIDDGSTTDIIHKLKELSLTRPNVIVKQIPNSGWPSKPRNVGTNIAKGVYILYLDHDDYLFPETFERVYQYGIENNADVVNGKEVRTKGWSWGWDQFKKNNPEAHKLGIQSLLPMTPHKFYRREFLLNNNITFYEGARVLWEDVYFNTKVYTAGATVAILSDYPTYYWIETGENNSGTFEDDPHEKWQQIRNLFQFFKDTIPEGNDLTFMLAHWYQTRILGMLGPWLIDKPIERISLEFEYARKVTSDLIPESIDNHVTHINKARAYLLRKGKVKEFIQLVKHDKTVTARSYATDIQWVNSGLKIDVTAEMTCNNIEPYILYSTTEGKIFRSVPKQLKNAIPDELLEITDEIDKCKYEISIKGRNSRVTWEIPVESSEVKTRNINSKELGLLGKAQVLIDIQKTGEILEKQPWDIASRFTAIGYSFHRGIVGLTGFGASALINGYTAVAYRNQSELLTIDTGSKVRSVVGTAKPKQSDLSVLNKRESIEINLSLPNTYVYGKTKIEGSIELTSENDDSVLFSAPAYLIGDELGARVTANVKIPSGRYRLSTIFEGRKSKTGLLITISDSEK
ncbi:glycosyltransferase family 2 protein [Lederbergia wuyishanensis]|uniref:Glycosyltransferase involved in cell wall biosynthesis n=1 Tax=Lederbergia wuyishanensis TaxID=1347903 RepID=A0ABU0D378_9BACI|nr:glycosyltransferase family 2 protein [Lederbergia wuyishanensis]MCJ8007976.1 glycosyltransferase [Lederbergia wuyishanensis]MDQ0342854.1 glycosyltransferase involved in cell wall biosynthesis [Lederbergia wuyishanensis]